ncbi:SURF1-like protein [Wyeomyia smithii]|uniref:SURF1-like protein n=1 Tax=Wyeomyia smithii TaxID=174621 RepID=UPI002467DA66|nr:SURF1-like protein [Wyeomyia smithii]
MLSLIRSRLLLGIRPLKEPFSRKLVHQNRVHRVPPPVKATNTTPPKISPFGWMLLAIPTTTFGLGCWQVHRKQWKEQLIRNLESRIHKDAVPLPDNLSELDEMEYQKVVVRGEFLHDQELHLGPRALIQGGDSKTAGGLFTQKEGSIGYWVITPFQLEGRDDKILINRGWVPAKQLNPATRQAGQIKGVVELEAVVRLPETRPQFTPKQRGAIFMYRDVPKMAQICNTEPYYLDAAVSTTVPNGPIGGQTRITLRNEHLSYIFTWFSLSGFTGWLWFRQIVRGKGF